MEEQTKDLTDLFASLIALIGLSNINYARSCKMSGQSDSGDPFKGGIYNNSIYCSVSSYSYINFNLLLRNLKLL